MLKLFLYQIKSYKHFSI